MNISSAVKKILIINIIVFIITLFSKSLILYLGVLPYGNGFMIWQPITAVFVHSGFGHIFWNMLFLFLVGPMIEIEYFRTAKRFTLYYLACGVGSSLISNLINFNGVCIGASGALFGLLVPLWVGFREIKMSLWGMVEIKIKTLIIILVSIQILLLLSQGDYSSFAHLSGLFVGIIIIYFYRKGTFQKNKGKQEITDHSSML